MAPRLNRALVVAAALAVVAAGILVYSPALGGFFQLDDFQWFGAVRGQRSLVESATFNVGWRSWRPLPEGLQYALLWRTVGMAALPAHLLSMAVYAVAALLTIRLAGVLGASPRQAVATGAIFALHDVHVMAVAWSATLNTSLFVVVACAHLIYVKRILEAPSTARWAGLAATALVAPLVHETAVVLPVADALLAVWLAPPGSWRRVRPLVAVYALALAGFAVWRIAVAGRYSHGPYALTVGADTARAFAWYVRLALVPNGDDFRGRAALVVAIALLMIAFTVAAWRRGDRLPAFGLALFGLTIAPAHLVPHHLADYYLTIPTLGLALTGGALVEAAWSHHRRAVHLAGSIALVAWLSTMALTARDRTRSIAGRGAALRAPIEAAFRARATVGDARLVRLRGVRAPDAVEALTSVPTPFEHLGIGPTCVEPACPAPSPTDVIIPVWPRR